MPTSVREFTLANTLSLLSAVLGPQDGDGTLKTLSRDHPVGQAVQARPALFLVELGERPLPGQTEEIEIHRLFFGTILLDAAKPFGDRSTGLNALDAAVHDVLENENAAPGDTYRRAGRDEPEANMTLPQGSTMTMWRVDYATVRGDPYTAPTT